MPMHNWNRVDVGVFHDMHLGWINAICDVLNGQLLSATHYALIEKASEPPVLNSGFSHTRTGTGSETDAAATTNAFNIEQPGTAMKEYPADESVIYAERASRVTIYRSSDDFAVGYVEIVSPGNKRAQLDFERFLDKLDNALMQGIHLLVIDPHPPSRRDPRGIYAAFWEKKMGSAHGVTEEQPLGLSAYRSDIHPTAYFEPFAVGDTLPDMPLFLTPDHYVNCPLESTYMAAWKGVPNRWKTVIEGDTETAT